MSTHPVVAVIRDRYAQEFTAMRDDGHWVAAETLSTYADDEVTVVQRYEVTPVTPPLPEEPPAHTVVNAGPVRVYRDDLDPRWFVMYGPDHGGWMTWPEVCALGTPEVLEPDSVKALRSELSDARERAGRYAADANLAESKVEQAETERNAALSILADVEERARAWTEKDAEPVDERGLAILSTINRLGREILHLLDATEDEPAEPAPVEKVTRIIHALVPTDFNVRARCGHAWDSDGVDGVKHLSKFNGKTIREIGETIQDGVAACADCLTLVETGGQS